MGMAELDKSVDFDYNSVELTDRLIQCAQHALPYFSTQVILLPEPVLGMHRKIRPFYIRYPAGYPVIGNDQYLAD